MSDSLELPLLLALAAVVLSLAVWLFLRIKRRDPRLRERRRLEWVSLHGRLGDGVITEADRDMLFYSYSVRGVIYTASQDIEQLGHRIDVVPERLIGPVTLKYLTNNPANSIVICENWSGLRPALSEPRSVRERNDS